MVKSQHFKFQDLGARVRVPGVTWIGLWVHPVFVENQHLGSGGVIVW